MVCLCVQVAAEVALYYARSVRELRIAATEREQVNAPPLQFEDEAATGASLCQMMMIYVVDSWSVSFGYATDSFRIQFTV